MAKNKNMLGQVLGSLLGSGQSGSGNATSSPSSSGSTTAPAPAAPAPAPAPIPAEAVDYGADLPEETDDGTYSPTTAPAAPEQEPAATSTSTEEPAAPLAPVTAEPAASPSTVTAPAASQPSTATTVASSLGQTATVREVATRLTRSSKASGAADDGLSLEEAARKRAQEVHQQRSMRNLLNGAATENDEAAETEETGALIVRHYYNAA